MELEEIIKKLRESYSLLTIINNMEEAYKINSYILNLLIKLKGINKQLSENLSAISIQISESFDLKTINNLSKRALTKLVSEEIAKESFLFGYEIIKTEDYKETVQNYSGFKKQIEETEKKIEKAESYQSDLHERIKLGKYKDCLHARINKNIRNIYYLNADQRKMFYIIILNHNDLDNSFRMKPVNWKNKLKSL